MTLNSPIENQLKSILGMHMNVTFRDFDAMLLQDFQNTLSANCSVVAHD